MLIVAVVLQAFVVPAALAADQYVVQVQKTQLRQSPSPFGKITGLLTAGQKVTELESKSGWYKVRPVGSAQTGWVHSSALNELRFMLQSGQAVSSDVSADEVALASKGFDEQVERTFKQQQKLDYSWVDKMEQQSVTDAEKLRFLKDGNLLQGGY